MSNSKDFIDEKRSQALRLNQPELRDFEQKLRNSLIFKQQQCQMKEKELEKIQDKRRQRMDAQEELSRHQKSKLIEEQKQEYIKRNKVDYAIELQTQIDLRKMHKHLEQQEDIQQRLADEAVRANIELENMKKINERIKNINTMQAEMELFQKSKELTSKKDKLIDLQESLAIEEYKKYEIQKKQIFAETLKQKAELKNEIFEIIAAKMLAQQQEAQEREKLIAELHEYEFAQRNQKHDSENMKLQMMKKEIVTILKAQISANILKEKKLHEEELEHRKHMAKQVTVYSRLENEKKIMEKLKGYQYASAISKQIEYEKKKQLELKNSAAKYDDHLRKMDSHLQTDIEVEKAKIVSEYFKPGKT